MWVHEPSLHLLQLCRQATRSASQQRNTRQERTELTGQQWLNFHNKSVTIVDKFELATDDDHFLESDFLWMFSLNNCCNECKSVILAARLCFRYHCELRVCFSGESLSGTPLTTSARISALNIVGELLRKVGVRSSAHVFHHLTYCHVMLQAVSPLNITQTTSSLTFGKNNSQWFFFLSFTGTEWRQ